jgi:hypothetical protein
MAHGQRGAAIAGGHKGRSRAALRRYSRSPDDVCFAAHYGLKSNIALGPKSANARNRCAIARCAGSPTASAVTGGKIVKTR